MKIAFLPLALHVFLFFFEVKIDFLPFPYQVFIYLKRRMDFLYFSYTMSFFPKQESTFLRFVLPCIVPKSKYQVLTFAFPKDFFL